MYAGGGVAMANRDAVWYVPVDCKHHSKCMVNSTENNWKGYGIMNLFKIQWKAVFFAFVVTSLST